MREKGIKLLIFFINVVKLFFRIQGRNRCIELFSIKSEQSANKIKKKKKQDTSTKITRVFAKFSKSTTVSNIPVYALIRFEREYEREKRMFWKN